MVLQAPSLSFRRCHPLFSLIAVVIATLSALGVLAQTLPAAPSGLSLDTTTTQTHLRVFWTDNSDNEERFYIERKSEDESDFTRIGESPVSVGVGARLGYNDLNLPRDTFFSYRVQAANANGVSRYSNIAGRATAPLVPGDLTATPLANEGQVRLTWRDTSRHEEIFSLYRKSPQDATFQFVTSLTGLTGTGSQVSYTDSGLDAGVTYEYYVHATNSMGDSPESNHVTATVRATSAVPNSPDQLGAVTPYPAPNAITVQFRDRSTNEDAFLLEGRAESESGFSLLATFPAWFSVGHYFTHTSSNLALDTAYSFRVKAQNAIGDSAYSETLTTYTAPVPPEDLTATPVAGSDNTIQLSWRDNSRYEQSFRIYRRNPNETEFRQIVTLNGKPGVGSTLLSNNTGLTAGATYEYYIVAVNEAGASSPSNHATATTNAAVNVPLAPSWIGTAFYPAPTSILVTFRDNSTNETSFLLERKSEDEANYSLIATLPPTFGTGTSLSYTSNNLAQDTAYTFRVKAKNERGDSAYSPLLNAATVPVAPSHLTAAPVVGTDDAIRLTWRDNSRREKSFRVYRLGPLDTAYVLAGVVAGKTGTGNTLQYTDTGLTAGISYQYQVTAANDAGESGPSEAASATTNDAQTPPLAPDNLTRFGYPARNAVMLSFRDQSTNEDLFTLERKSEDEAAFSVAEVLPPSYGANTYLYHAFTDLAPDTLYTFRAQAINSVGASDYSNAVTALSAPLTPTGFTAVLLTANSVKLQWTDASRRESEFRVYRKDPDLPFPSLIALVSGKPGKGSLLTFTDLGVVTDTTYDYYLVATNEAGDSLETPHLSVRVAPPKAPSGLVVSVLPGKSDRLKLDWTDNSTDETSFRLYRRKSGESSFALLTTAGSGTTTFLNTGLQPSTQYFYQVTAVNAAGESAPSNEANGTTPALDTALPETTITAGPAENALVCDSTVPFTFTGSDDVTATANLRYRWRLTLGTVGSGSFSAPAKETTATLSGLSDGDYLFEVVALDEANHEDASPASRRFTIDTLLPTVSSVLATPTTTGAIITWSSNRPTTSQVKYRRAGASEWESTNEDVTYLTAHSVTLTHLKPATQYEFLVLSKDRCGRKAESSPDIFQTKPDTTPPNTTIIEGPVDGGYVQPGEVVFVWRGSDDVTPTEQITYQYQLDEGDWEPVVPSVVATVTFNLGDQARHVFRVRAYDASGNVDPTPAVVVFRTDSTAPTFLAADLLSVTTDSALFAWKTDEPTTGVIQYDGGNGHFDFQQYDPVLKTDHQLLIQPLASLTSYRARILAYDVAGNIAISQTIDLSTLGRHDLGVSAEEFGCSNNGPQEGEEIVLSGVVRNLGDYSQAADVVFREGSREVGRVAVELPTHAPPVRVFSPPFQLSAGPHTLTVRLENSTTSDEEFTNDSASKDILVDAPACRLAIGVSTPVTFPGDVCLFTAWVRNTGSQAQAVTRVDLAGTGWVTLVSSLPQAPLEPGETLELTFQAAPPPTQPGGPANAPVRVPFTLSVYCGKSFTQAFEMEVYSTLPTQPITLLDAVFGTPLPGATLFLAASDQELFTDGQGHPTDLLGNPVAVPLRGTSHLLSAVERFHSPRLRSLASGDAFTLALQPGRGLRFSEASARPLHANQIRARGLDQSNADKMAPWDFTLLTEGEVLAARNVFLPKLPIPGSHFRFDSETPGYRGKAQVSYLTADPEQWIESWLLMAGRTASLKQAFEVVFLLINRSPAALQNVEATLILPEGLSLVRLFGESQQRLQSLGSLPPGGMAQVRWIVRGDRSGLSRLRATFTETTGGLPSGLSGELESDAFSVQSPALLVTPTVPASVTADTPFLLTLQLKNVSEMTLRGVEASLKGVKLSGCQAASGESLRKGVGTLLPGETRTVAFQLVAPKTGRVEVAPCFTSGPSVEPAVTVIPTQRLIRLSGKVTLLNSQDQRQPIRFELRSRDGNNPLPQVITLDSEGGFVLTSVPVGVYDLAVKGSRWLRRTVSLNASGSDLDGITITLLPGDANDDNSVDIFDLATLAEAFNTTPTDGRWNPNTDFTCDNSVDIFDLATLAENFNRNGDP